VVKKLRLQVRPAFRDLLSEVVKTTGGIPSARLYIRNGRIIRIQHVHKPGLNHLGPDQRKLRKCQMTYQLHGPRALRLSFLHRLPGSRAIHRLDLSPIQQHIFPAQIAPTVSCRAILLQLPCKPYHTGQLTTRQPPRWISRISGERNHRPRPRRAGGPASHSWNGKWNESEKGSASGRKGRRSWHRPRETPPRESDQARLGTSTNTDILAGIARIGVDPVLVLEGRGGRS
jgi:hypothetical protein